MEMTKIAIIAGILAILINILSCSSADINRDNGNNSYIIAKDSSSWIVVLKKGYLESLFGDCWTKRGHLFMRTTAFYRKQQKKHFWEKDISVLGDAYKGLQPLSKIDNSFCSLGYNNDVAIVSPLQIDFRKQGMLGKDLGPHELAGEDVQLYCSECNLLVQITINYREKKVYVIEKWARDKKDLWPPITE
jgi:hypothetical protein